MTARAMLILLVAGLAPGCAGSIPPGHSSPDATGDTLPGDMFTTDGPADLFIDATSADGLLVNTCSSKTADGLALNPGCDPDFKAKGPTAVGQFTDINTGKAAWMFTCGKKFWVFDPKAGVAGAFTSGGKDLAAALRSLPPDCATKSADGTFLNPGCDPTFQANGPTALGEVKDAATKKVSWLFSSGKKYWVFDSSAASGKGAFCAAGAALAATTATISPDCSVQAADGTPLNPGCDITFKANGLTAWGEFFDAATKKSAWMFVSGTKYWIFDATASSGKGAFGAAGADLSAALINLSPDCTSKAADGTPLNPGCDPDFKVNGPTAIGEMLDVSSGRSSWLFTTQKKFWLYDVTGGAFVAAGGDIAKTMLKLAP